MLCWGRKVLNVLDESSLRSLEESYRVANVDEPHARVQAWVNESADFRRRRFGSLLRRLRSLRLILYSERQPEHQEFPDFEGWIPNRESECCSCSYSDV